MSFQQVEEFAEHIEIEMSFVLWIESQVNDVRVLQISRMHPCEFKYWRQIIVIVEIFFAPFCFSIELPNAFETVTIAAKTNEFSAKHTCDVCPSVVLLIFDNALFAASVISQKARLYMPHSRILWISYFNWKPMLLCSQSTAFLRSVCAFCDYFIPCRWKPITFYVLMRKKTYVYSIATFKRTSICPRAHVCVSNNVVSVCCRKISHYDNNNKNKKKNRKRCGCKLNFGLVFFLVGAFEKSKRPVK